MGVWSAFDELDQECFEATAKIVSNDKVAEADFELPVAIVMVTFDSPIFDHPVHPFDLTAWSKDALSW